MGEHLALSDLAAWLHSGTGMWQIEHSSSIAAFDSGWSMVSRRTLPCQYGSRAELAMMLAANPARWKQSLPARRGHAVVTGQAAVRGLKLDRLQRHCRACPRAAPGSKAKQQSEPRRPYTASTCASPALRQLAVGPIPQQVEHQLHLTARRCCSPERARPGFRAHVVAG